jgi:heme/copper-type cytochrome/quinol oxidase subunit 2
MLKTQVLCIVGLFRDPVLRRAMRCLFVATVSVLLVCQIAPPALAQGQADGNPLASLVKLAVNGLIIVAALLMTFAIAFTGVMSMMARMAGMPYAEANATMKIIGIVILFIIVAFAIPLSNAVIDNVMEYHSNEDIRVPSF